MDEREGTIGVGETYPVDDTGTQWSWRLIFDAAQLGHTWATQEDARLHAAESIRAFLPVALGEEWGIEWDETPPMLRLVKSQAEEQE